MLRALDSIPIEGDSSVHVDDDLLREVFADPAAMSIVYARDPEVSGLIESDAEARDVIALQRRREVVDRMRSWLEDGDAFDSAQREAGGPERAWQRLLEENPWVLGVGLAGQLLTSWTAANSNRRWWAGASRASASALMPSSTDGWCGPVAHLRRDQAPSHGSARRSVPSWMLAAIKRSDGRRGAGATDSTFWL